MRSTLILYSYLNGMVKYDCELRYADYPFDPIEGPNVGLVVISFSNGP